MQHDAAHGSRGLLGDTAEIAVATKQGGHSGAGVSAEHNVKHRHPEGAAKRERFAQDTAETAASTVTTSHDADKLAVAREISGAEKAMRKAAASKIQVWAFAFCRCHTHI